MTAGPARASLDTNAARGSTSRFARDLEARHARYIKERTRAQAIVPLMGLVSDLWDMLDDRAPLLQFLDEASADPRTRPDVRARAKYLDALVLDRLGRTSDAAKQRGQLGLITKFWVLGPFDNEGRTGHATAFKPESELAQPLDPKKQYDGKERAVSWRLLPEIATQGLVALDAALRPDTNVTAYLTTLVHVDKATRAAIRVGSSGAIKVWVNGQLALDRDVYRPVRFDQDVAPCLLAAGWNRLTLKVSASDQAWGFFARLTTADGETLPDLQVSTELAQFGHVEPMVKKAPKFAVSDMRRELERAAKDHPRDAQAWSDLALYLLHVAPDDPEKKLAAEAFTRAAQLKPSPQLYWLLAQSENDPNDRMRALEQGLEPALAAKFPQLELAPLYSTLGVLYHQARRERRAESAWLDGRTADPEYWPVTIHLAELAAERGVPARAVAMLAQLDKEHPSLRVLRAEAQLELRRGRHADAQRMYQRVAEAEHDDVDSLRELYAYARSRGLADQALTFIDRIAEARPDVLQTALDRADVLEGIGKTAEAHQALTVALQVAPEETRLLERDGRLLHKLGRETEALAELHRALEIRPQNPELRTYVHQLEAKDDKGDLARAWAVDVAALIKKTPKADPKKTDRARVLLDQDVIRVHANGLSESFQQRVVEILDERGAREESAAEIRYTPDTQSIEVRAARVYKRSGEVIEVPPAGERDMSEPWYGLYYDVKAQVIDFDALEPGDVIDVEYVISDVARRNMFADYFGDLHLMQEDAPRLQSRYVLIAPKNKTLYFNKPRLTDLRRSVENHGNETEYIFDAFNIPKIDPEPGMPGFTDLAAYLHVSTYKTWDEVAAWYRGLVAEQLQPSPAIDAAVREAVKGLSDERQKIRAVYDLVVRKTRYVGLEFGIHGYQPYRVSQIFARKFGDCKDKASLMVVMLRQIGVEASLVLARTRHGGDLDAEPASLAPFDHAIVYVPKYDLFLDGTAEFSGAEELPAQDQDIPVLIVNEGKLRRTPVLPAVRNYVDTTQELQLSPSGAAEVSESIVVAGEVAHEWRQHYQSPSERAERFGKALSATHPGTKVERVDMPGLGDLERPVTVKAQLSVPDWGHVEGEDISLPAVGREADMQRSYARLSSRKLDLVLGFPWQQRDRLLFTVPAGMKVKRLPDARKVQGPFGSFTINATQTGGRVDVQALLSVEKHRIAREDYEAFRRFCAEVDAALGQTIVIGK
jgi:transglutaminase-like putative cysteine protease/tetratricopeptide (TPR) repeat protein